MKGFLGACCLGAVLICRAQAAAVVLYEQPLTTDPVGLYGSLSGRQTADRFELSADATMSGVKWYELYAAGAGVHDPTAWPIDCGIRFFTENGGSAGTLISDQTVLAIVQDSGFSVTEAGSFSRDTVDEFQADRPAGVFVDPGVTTRLSSMDAEPGTLGGGWFWSHSPPRNGDAPPGGDTDVGTWTLPGGNSDRLAFTLEGEPVTIIAPGAFVFGGIGVVLLGWLRRRRGSAGRLSH